MEREDGSRSKERWIKSCFVWRRKPFHKICSLFTFCLLKMTTERQITGAAFWLTQTIPSSLTKLDLSFFGDPVPMVTLVPGRPAAWAFSTMQYFGGKLSAAQLQVAGWVGGVRRSLQGALELVWGTAEEKPGEEEEEEEKEEEEEGGDGGGRFQRAMSPLRSFARRSRRSLRRFSVRSRQTLQRRATESCSVRADLVTQKT